MKIGILTWYFGANYGAKLHSLALQKSLENIGHEAYLISYKPAGFATINKKMNINCPHYRKHPIHYLSCLIRCKRFDEFNRNYKITTDVYAAEDINKLGLDCVILGSDAIFNINHPLFSDIYFGVGINTPKFTYAPSCENVDVNSNLTDTIKESVGQFVGISTRDEKTADLLKSNVSVETTQVLDPTFLYDFLDLTPDVDEREYLLLYTFSDWSCYKKQIEEYAHNHNLRILSVGRYYAWADKSYDAASVYQWLGLMKNASIVFTDSFHGLCFSIKNNKQFVIVSRPDKREKNQDLMNKAGIKNSFYDGKISIEDYLSNPIQYDVVNKNILALKEQSINYLTDCIRSVNYK